MSAIGHHIGHDEGVMIYLWFCLCLYENMPAERQNVMFTAVIDKELLCTEFWRQSFSVFTEMLSFVFQCFVVPPRGKSTWIQSTTNKCLGNVEF